jgi:BirA family biotin operon repressor/biotin-[acetyl-CoA-carboxylase] ligase
LTEGLIVFAEEQTAGRGQRGNRWASAAGLGLWFSILLRPQLQPAKSARLTQWVSEGIVRTIEREFGLRATIKPPNDVFLGGRKIAGVLVEMKAGKGSDLAAIVGIGVNVNHAEKDFPVELRAVAGSLAMVLGHPVNRTKLALALLKELDETRAAVESAAGR